MRKTHLISDSRTKNISLAGARTHQNDTRPEEICDHESVCVLDRVKLVLFDFRENLNKYHFPKPHAF